MFDHNIGEIAEAEELAKELGINQISFVTPYQVDDPKITADNLPEPRKVVFHNDLGKMWNAHQQSARALSPDIDEAFDNFMALEVKPEHSRSAARNKCHWLYEQTVMDAGGRILPCCGAPMKETWIFADRVAAGVFNNEKYISARELGDGADTACHTCPVVDGSRLPNVHAPEAFPHFLRGMDWLGLLPIDQLQPLWDYAPDRAEA